MSRVSERYRLFGEALRSCYEITSGIASLTATVGLLCEGEDVSSEDYAASLKMCAALELFVPSAGGATDAMWKLLSDACPESAPEGYDD